MEQRRGWREKSGGEEGSEGGGGSGKLLGGHAFFFCQFGVSFFVRQELEFFGTETRSGNEAIVEWEGALFSGWCFVHGGLVCRRAEARGREKPAARRAEKSLSARDGFARQVVSYLVFGGA